MSALNERIPFILDALHMWGARANHDDPYPSDEELWAMARTIEPNLHLLGHQPPNATGTAEAGDGADPRPAGDTAPDDAAILTRFRAAYASGRRPSRTFRLQDIIDLLAEAGYDARIVVPQPGASTTDDVQPGAVRLAIGAGEPDHHPDHHGVPRWTAIAGPARYDRDGVAVAETRDLVIRSDGGTDPVVLTPTTTDGEIARLIGTAVEDGRARRQRIAAAVEAATLAFWRTLARQFPEVPPGRDPGAASSHGDVMRSFQQWAYRAARAWLAEAAPAEGIAPTSHAGDQIVQARTRAAVQRLAAHIADRGLTSDQLYDLAAQAVRDQVDDLVAAGDFAPIGDDAARYALQNHAEYRLTEAAGEGTPGPARLLYEVLGEPAAIAAIGDATDATPNHVHLEHDCQDAGTLTFVGTYGAPGFGQAWRCAGCGREWARLGDQFYPAEDLAHIMTPDQCE